MNKAKVSRILLLGACAAGLLARTASAGDMDKKLRRCRERIADKSYQKALDCFSEIMAEGGREDQKTAAFFLDILASEGARYNVPTLEEARLQIKAKEDFKPEHSGGAIPTAVIYHDGRPREDLAPAPRPAAPGRRQVPPARAKPARPAFVIEDVSENSTAIRPARPAVLPAKKTLPMVGSAAGVEDVPSRLRDEARETEPAETIEVSSFAFREMLAAAPEAVKAEKGAASSDLPLPENSVQPKDEEGSNVAIAGAEAAPAAYEVQDDITPGAAPVYQSAGQVRFELNSVDISETQSARLEASAAKIKSGKLDIIIKGFSSPEENNPENLARIRAKVVYQILSRKYGVPKKKLTQDSGVGVNQEDQTALLLIR